MNFNSIEYFMFLIGVVLISKLFSNKRRLVVLIASIFFYGYCNVFDLSLLYFVVILSYLCGLVLYKIKTNAYRKIILAIAISIILGQLIYFKYLNFICGLISTGFSSSSTDIRELILPLGISFFSLQSIGYCIDIYHQRIEPEKSIVNYALFLTFFPQLIAGPIERAKRLLPQLKSLETKRIQVYPHINRIVFGLWKKIVIADGVANLTGNIIHSNYDLGLSNIFLGYLFYIQIYCDFSAYIDIAIGSAQIFGVKLTENFDSPYLADSFKDFWHRWHISLSEWFRDYLYIPLGGNRVSTLRFGLIIMVLFFVSGIWHGANWNFVLWGGIHGIAYLFESITNNLNGMKKTRYFISRFKKVKIFIVFNLISLTWIVFFVSDFSTLRGVFFNIYSSVINLEFSSLMNIFNLLISHNGLVSIILPVCSLFFMLLIENLVFCPRFSFSLK